MLMLLQQKGLTHPFLADTKKYVLTWCHFGRSPKWVFGLLAVSVTRLELFYIFGRLIKLLMIFWGKSGPKMSNFGRFRATWTTKTWDSLPKLHVWLHCLQFCLYYLISRHYYSAITEYPTTLSVISMFPVTA